MHKYRLKTERANERHNRNKTETEEKKNLLYNTGRLSQLTCTEPCRSAGVRLPSVAPGFGTSGHAATPPLAFVCGWVMVVVVEVVVKDLDSWF